MCHRCVDAFFPALQYFIVWGGTNGMLYTGLGWILLYPGRLFYRRPIGSGGERREHHVSRMYGTILLRPKKRVDVE